MSESIKPLPCPFCGKDTWIEDCVVTCRNKDCHIFNVHTLPKLWNCRAPVPSDPMSKRDVFAAMAMQGILTGSYASTDELVKDCFEIADAFIAWSDGRKPYGH